MADIPFGGTGILRFGATFTNTFHSVKKLDLAENTLNRRPWIGKLTPGSSILVRGEQEAVYSLDAAFGDCSYPPPYWRLRFGASSQGESATGGISFLSDLELSTVSLVLVPSKRRRAMADFRQLALDFVLEDDQAKLTALAQRAAKGVL
jgi:hypothetical protein